MTVTPVVLVGAGIIGRYWAMDVIGAPNSGCTLMGVVDVDTDKATAVGRLVPVSGGYVGDSLSRAVQRAADACGERPVCVVAVPPDRHEDAVHDALESGADVLLEKPIAASWDACLRIAERAADTGRRVQVVQNYRYWPGIAAARDVVRSGELGAPVLATCRFAADYRKADSWGAYRHRMLHPLLLDGAWHHFDQLAYILRSTYIRVVAEEWTPDHARGVFDGAPSLVALGRFAAGCRFAYEGNLVAAGDLANWTNEIIRVQCERGSISATCHMAEVVGEDRQTRRVRGPSDRHESCGHHGVLTTFLNWRAGSPPPDENIAGALRTASIVFGAIESVESGAAVDLVPRLRAAEKIAQRYLETVKEHA